MDDDLEFKQDFEIELTREVEDKIKWLTHNYEQEISAWLGGEVSENKILIDDLLFPTQEVSGASIDTDTKALINLRKEYKDRCLRIIGHWHSHNNMSVDWSSVDDDFIEKYMSSRDLRVFLVSSIDDGIRARLELRNPIKLSIDNLKLNVNFINSDIEKELKRVIEEKVVEKKIVVSVKGKNNNVTWEDKEDWDDKEDIEF